MLCPNCNGDHFGVIETRKTDTVVYRVRKCKENACGWLATTHEIIPSDQVIPKAIRRPKKEKIQ